MESNMMEINLEELAKISGGELTQELKDNIDRHMRYLKSKGIWLETILRTFSSRPEWTQYIKEHWDSY